MRFLNEYIKALIFIAIVATVLVSAWHLSGPVFFRQPEIGGQELPNAYYLSDDVQYHPTGPEFKLWREAEALKQCPDETFLGPPAKEAGDTDG